MAILSLTLLYQNCGGSGFEASSLGSIVSSEDNSDPTPAPEPTPTPAPEPTPTPAPEPTPTEKKCAHPDSGQMVPGGTVYSYYQRPNGTSDECIASITSSACSGSTGTFVPAIAQTRYFSCLSSSTTPSTYPAWRQGMSPFQWKKISNTSINTITPQILVSGQEDADGMGIAGVLGGRMTAWNGLAANTDTNRVYSAANGGHADYAGNEVYEIDFSVDSPKWRILREPTEAKYIRASCYMAPCRNGLPPQYIDYYDDGRPSSTHTYYALQFHRGLRSILKVGAGSLYGSGNEGNSIIDAFSLVKNDWEPAQGRPFYGPSARHGMIGQAVCVDPVTEEVYIGAPGKLKKFNPLTSEVIEIASYFENATEISGAACAVDPVNKQVVFFRDAYRADSGGLRYDLVTKVYTRINFTGVTHAVSSRTQSYAWYDQKLNAFLLKTGSGSQIVRVDPITYASTEWPTVGGGAMLDAINGVQTRFQALPKLKGYIYYPDDPDGFWFLATE
jgi:hypothetical protein